ncbi:hypothetical protein BDN71DRAFT_1436548 [Pleurotus eryngii]|uniref:Uncharacterized protein n=1 Tax=Pleurotus eryngii TaxID=5323 RepID=A0A9P5ZJP3_PLEER|nr:hypothetical protein BDN71DRAFT_1436548 [Pleurotus eryngii]
MKICNESFQHLTNQLSALGYARPVGLSCNDTKLLPSLQLYWDKDKNSYFLVVSVDGPIRVVNADEIKQALQDTSVVKAEKLCVWCVVIPLLKVTPIIFACMGIPNNLSAGTLYVYLKQVLNGLIKNNILVVSYTCDGTKVEQSVQCKLVADYGQGATLIKITIPIFNRQPIVMIQYSKHALKTFHNNLFAGAHLLTLGNHIAAYQFVQEIAFMPGSPLYHQDVEKLDQQDDNAAACLFSAATLEFIIATHPQYVGLIVYLFIFVELHIKMALWAYHFINMWKTYLMVTKHKHMQHLISHEALDIANIIIKGLISLVLVYQDHINSSVIPLLSWLHSTEACEHTFSVARAVVKDFTLLDFVYMVPKLGVKLWEAVMMAKVTGVHPSQLHKIMKSHTPEPILPLINSWFNDSDVGSDDEESVCEVQDRGWLMPKKLVSYYTATSMMSIVLAVDNFIVVTSVDDTSVHLMNGTVLTYERAHVFMAFYGQQFALSKPIVRINMLPHKPGSSAIMMFGKSHMSYRSGPTDRAAKQDCYLKGAHKVESFDSEIWKLFITDEVAKAQATPEQPAAAAVCTSTCPRAHLLNLYELRPSQHVHSLAMFLAAVMKSSTASASSVGLQFGDVDVDVPSF